MRHKICGKWHMIFENWHKVCAETDESAYFHSFLIIFHVRYFMSFSTHFPYISAYFHFFLIISHILCCFPHNLCHFPHILHVLEDLKFSSSSLDQSEVSILQDQSEVSTRPISRRTEKFPPLPDILEAIGLRKIPSSLPI